MANLTRLFRIAALLSSFVVFCAPARADSWGPFTSRVVPSPSGMYYVVVANDDSRAKGPLPFWFCQVPEGAEPIKAMRASWPPVGNEPVRPREGDTVLAEGELEQIPYRLFVADAGFGFAAVDEHGSLGYGWAVVLVDARGLVFQRKKLDQIFEPERIKRFPRSVSSIWWFRDAWFHDDRRELVVVDRFNGMKVLSFDKWDVRDGGDGDVHRALYSTYPQAHAIAVELCIERPIGGVEKRLVEFARSKGVNFAIRAIVALAAGGSAEWKAEFLDMITGKDRIGGPEAERIFDKGLPGREAANEELKAAAFGISQLQRFLGPDAAPAIRRVIGKYTAAPASAAMVKIGKPALPVLRAMLEDPDRRQRCVAAEVLGQIGDLSDVNGLVKAARDDDPSVNSRAARAAEQLCKDQPIQVLASVMGADEDVDRFVVVFFQRKKYPEAVVALIEAMEKATFKGGIARALRSQTGQDFGLDWEAWKRWHDNG